MGRKFGQISVAFEACFFLALGLLWSANSARARNYDYTGNEINQKDAGGLASNNYWNGSGDSKDEGVRNAMRALNRLASLDIGGAIHYGYKGYGNYANSQRMDDLDGAAWRKKASMNSISNQMIGGGSSAGSGNNGGDVTGKLGPQGENARLENNGSGQSGLEKPPKQRFLKDMDRGFLYRGETGEVAAEFEKRSGMGRETFFNMLADAESRGFNWDDPNLMDKVESQYQLFVSKVPNKEYRANIEKAHALFPMAKKLRVFEEALAFYQKTRYGEDGGAAAAAAEGIGGESTVVSAQNAPISDGEASRNPASEAPASISSAKLNSEEAPRYTKKELGMYLGLTGSHSDELKDVLGPEETLFRLVSKRYRKLTPMMNGRIL